jgi:hypothetical protein
VCDGSAEDAEDGVADELVDDSPMSLERLANVLVVPRQECSHVLGVELLGALREADEIREEDRDHSALLARGPRVRAAHAASV